MINGSDCKPDICEFDSHPILQKILKNCTINSNNCFNYNLSLASEYPMITVDRKRYKVHRLVYMLCNNCELTATQLICHQCDNKRCCNPKHLLLGDFISNRQETLQRINYSVPSNYKLRKPNGLIGLPLVNWCLQNTFSQNDCLIYKGTPNKNGYFQIKVDYVNYRLHRYIYCVLNNLSFDTKFLIRHLCNNKSCINPEHLKHGTNKENALDSVEQHPNTILSKDKVKFIREYITDDDVKTEKFAELADKYRCKPATIKAAYYNVYWK